MNGCVWVGNPAFVPQWIELVVLPLHLILILLSILVLAVASTVGALFSPFTLALIDVLNLMMLSCKELASYLLLYQPGFQKEVTEHAYLSQTPNPKPEGRLSESTILVVVYQCDSEVAAQQTMTAHSRLCMNCHPCLCAVAHTPLKANKHGNVFLL